jgi:hypothetical protein
MSKQDNKKWFIDKAKEYKDKSYSEISRFLVIKDMLYKIYKDTGCNKAFIIHNWCMGYKLNKVGNNIFTNFQMKEASKIILKYLED